MGSLINLQNFKTIEEWRTFAEKQFITIQFLQESNKKLDEELQQLKKRLNSGQGLVEKIIVSPEQALLDDQILMIQQRAYMKELNLEDVKKLNILLKHSRTLKADAKLLEGKSKPVILSNEDLLQIAQGSENGPK